MDIGVRNAEFDVLAEIEIDEHCCSTLLANAEINGYDITKVIQADIRTLLPKQLLTIFR